MVSSLFWNRPPARAALRSVDPLGFDALREAISDRLVPLLTGATRDADEYLWTLVGLRWARESTGSRIDATLFDRGFAPFERALKQHWYRAHGRTSAGIKVVREICDGPRPDVSRPILVNQRATGLLGNYIVSLREMKLVERDSLLVMDDAVERLLADVPFAPTRGWTGSWATLARAFSKVTLGPARRRLGAHLFSGVSPEMNAAARSVRAHPAATSWGRVGKRQLDPEQARLATAATAVVRIESAALEAFAELLRGQRNLSTATGKALRSLAAATRDADPFPPSWDDSAPLRSPIGDAWSSLARGEDAAPVLLRLHLAVTHARQTEPWLLHLGDMPADFQRWRPGVGVPDFRFRNLRTLVRQTRWRPHAA